MTIQVQIRGVDVSHHNGDIDWSQVAGTGCGFAYIKASDGIAYQDPLFPQNWGASGAAGIARGAYHFFRPDHPGTEQANQFLRTLRGDYGQLPCVLDVEALPAPENLALFIRELASCVQLIAQASTRIPWLYTSKRVWAQLGNPPGFQSCGLWVAHWGVSRPSLPPSWSSYAAWQFTDEGRVPGINGPVDLDFLNTALDRNALSPQQVAESAMTFSAWQ